MIKKELDKMAREHLQKCFDRMQRQQRAELEKIKKHLPQIKRHFQKALNAEIKKLNEK